MAAAVRKRTVRLGDADVEFPSPALQQIEDSAPLLALGDGGAALREGLDRDGFVFLRGALGREAVLAARAVVVRHLVAKGDVLAAPAPLAAGGGAGAAAVGGDDSVLLEACNLGCLPNMEGVNSVTHHADTLAVLEGAPIRRAVGLCLGRGPESLATFDYKWCRAVGRRTFTGCHCDAVYMARGSPRLLTCWIPFDDAATLELGALAMCRGSHALPGFALLRETYGRFDTEAEPGFEGSGWLTSDPREVSALDAGAQWVSGDYAAGDVIIFGMRTLHMSTANMTERVRISCDVRFQPGDEPIDDRYIGSAEQMRAKQAERKKGGAYSAAMDGGSEGPVVSMADLRRRWGV